MNYDSSDFAGGVPMNEPDAVRCCAPAASAYSDGIPAGYLDNPCIPAGSHNRSHKVMEHRKLEIRKVIGREILDSRGNPTVEAQVMLKDGTVGMGKSPSGASTGAFEAVELRDMNLKRYGGKGTLKAVNHINVELNNSVLAMDSSETYSVDKAMIDEDKTHDKARFGANSILAVSIAAARAAAQSLHQPLYRFLGGVAGTTLPVPLMNIINGGRHAVGSDFQEYMIVPAGAPCFREALRMGTEVFHSLRDILSQRGYVTTVGDEGGFAPAITNADEVFAVLQEAVMAAGYEPGKDVYFAMDAAASELYNTESGLYEFAREYAALGNSADGGIKRSTEELINYYEMLVNKFPIISIEDPLNEEDWSGWKSITERLGEKVQIVGDDLFVTNTVRLKKGIEMGCANSILIKPNQIGTLSETLEAVKMAHRYGYTAIASHRSGETDDTTIADLAVALNMGQIKTGAPSRAERIAKYNRLLQIEDELGESATYAGIEAFGK